VTTLRARLSLALGACLLAFSLLLWAGGNRLFDALARDIVAAQLNDAAETLLAALVIDAAGSASLSITAPEYDKPFSGHYFALRVGAHTLRSRSLWDETLVFDGPTVGAVELRDWTGPQRQPLLLRVASYVKQGRPVTIAVAADLAPLDSYRRRLGLLMAGLTACAVLALALAQHAVLRVSLRPLDRIRAALHALDSGAAARLDETVPAEVLPLVREVNRLLATLGQRVERSRHALGDLAHALKTPLQLLDDDLGQLPPDSEPVRDARERTASIGALVERALRRARLAGTGAGTARFRYDEDLDELCATMRQLHRERAIDIQRAATGIVHGDREDVQELLGNLLDNACKWARQRVRVDVAATVTTLRVVVADDGDGLPPSVVDHALLRGARLDETRRGHGLGLGIVSDIVAVYRGDIRFATDAALGGLAVTVTLPRADTDAPA